MEDSTYHQDLSSQNDVVFTINGIVYRVKNDIPLNTTLVVFLRNIAGLPGTKFMCEEGGCGSCVVFVKYNHPVTKKEIRIAVNSCLMLVYGCHGWSLTTIEGIGNKLTGYSKEQNAITAFDGTQCGFCTPGFISTMYSLRQKNKNLTKEDVEKSLGGNICRCTGFRPIFDAFKSLAKDATPVLADIEDLAELCPKLKEKYQKCEDDKETDIVDTDGNNFELDFLELALASESLRIKYRGPSKAQWYRVSTVQEIFEIFCGIPDNEPYMLVSGNTAQGAYRNSTEIIHYIDVKSVPELRQHTCTAGGLKMGGNMTLAEMIEVFRAQSVSSPRQFNYMDDFADHMEMVANPPVRNIATLAGNLALKRQQPGFPSDIFFMLVTVGASIEIRTEYGTTDTMPAEEFLMYNLNKKVIIGVIFPPIDSNRFHLKSYKIAPRAENAPGIVNAGFLFDVNKNENWKIRSKPTIVFGGINSNFIHAENTESYLNGKQLKNDNILQEALCILYNETKPDFNPEKESPEYRRKLATSLFYRFVLSIDPTKVKPEYASGAVPLKRGLSSGLQEYTTDTDKWPVNQPVMKLEAVSQASGEADYINDITYQRHELAAAFVITKLAVADITSIDPSEALKIPGVIRFFSAKDIPGENTWLPFNLLFLPEKELLFAETKSLYAGMPVGLIVAKTRDIALKASEKVKIQYSNYKKPMLYVKDVVKSGDKSRITRTNYFVPIVPPVKFDVKYTVKGDTSMGEQYHFPLELQCCLSVPHDGGLTVYSSTQWQAVCQEGISLALNIPQSKIEIVTKRVGGSYGLKLTRAALPAVGASLAAYLLNKPVRLVMNLEHMMQITGKRHSNYSEYEAGVNKHGLIRYLNIDFYLDDGISFNDPNVFLIIASIGKTYDRSSWSFNGFDVKTDKASTVWTRSPGTCEASGTVEYIIEHIAKVCGKDPVEVRLLNRNPNADKIETMINKLKESTHYVQRRQYVDSYNRKNRWKKKGISLIANNFAALKFGPMHALVTIYKRDGSVTVTHGGIEMGQGLNTKVAQVVAKKLGVDLKTVTVKATGTTTAPNNCFTANSTGSEQACRAAILACDELNLRLAPIRLGLLNPTWVKLLKAADLAGVSLAALSHAPVPFGIFPAYDIVGVAVTEVEIDVLTGKKEIRRVDILEDAGQSLSPRIDIGQVEGAFIMGMGYYTTEITRYDLDTGELKTNRTWNYFPPSSKDIPQDFRVNLLSNSDNPVGVLSSKATGEPPLCLAVSVPLAIRDAVHHARLDGGKNDTWFEFHPPVTTEKTFMSAFTSLSQYKLNS